MVINVHGGDFNDAYFSSRKQLVLIVQCLFTLHQVFGIKS